MILFFGNFQEDRLAPSGTSLASSLGLDYPGLDVPDWVIVKLGPLAAKGDITAGEFKTALEYVLEHVLEHS